MLFPLPRHTAALAFAALSGAGLASCRESAARVNEPAPDVEFIVAAGDSSYWISSGRQGVQLRAAPLELARVDGRFYELYVVDEDLSYEDAVLVGQRVYRRDLVTGDSLLVFADTLVPRLAERYARSHPRDRRIEPDDDGSEDPRWRATATLELGEVSGPFVSYDQHTDVERDDAPFWHSSRRGVLNIRAARAASLADVAGSAAREVEARRTGVLRLALDSVRARRDESGERAASMLAYYQLDPSSFALTSVGGNPAIAYALPGAGDGDAGHLLPLSPIAFTEPAWWRALASTLPVPSANGNRDSWRHGSVEVIVRYDSLSGAATLSLRDSSQREWPVARVPAPATHIFWLDSPPLDARARSALVRAFRESAMYDESVRTAVDRRTTAAVARPAYARWQRQSPTMHVRPSTKCRHTSCPSPRKLRNRPNPSSPTS